VEDIVKSKVVVIIVCIAIIILGVAAYLAYADLLFSGVATTSTSGVSDLARLAYGTIALSETDYAVPEENAESLLSLWQATKILVDEGSLSDSAMEAMYDSIRSSMTDEQLKAINDLVLDSDSIQEYIVESRNMSGIDTNGFAEGANSEMQDQVPTIESDSSGSDTTTTTNEADEETADSVAVDSVISYLQGLLGIQPTGGPGGNMSFGGAIPGSNNDSPPVGEVPSGGEMPGNDMPSEERAPLDGAAPIEGTVEPLTTPSS